MVRRFLELDEYERAMALEYFGKVQDLLGDYVWKCKDMDTKKMRDKIRKAIDFKKEGEVVIHERPDKWYVEARGWVVELLESDYEINASVRIDKESYKMWCAEKEAEKKARSEKKKRSSQGGRKKKAKV